MSSPACSTPSRSSASASPPLPRAAAPRNPREDARRRLGGAHDPRVLEPSPPAVTDEPYFADDPLDGGDVLPVSRSGVRTWGQLSKGDADLRAWCEDRWLVRRPLTPLPDTFVETRLALHRVAEDVMAPARQAANGKIGLRFTYRGFGTPFFGEDEQLRVEDGVLLANEQPQSPLSGVDQAAATALGDWFGYCASLFEQLRADATDAEAASRVQLWPEHFDMSVDLGVDGKRANYGGSPGDAEHPEPYLYVGPWDRSNFTEGEYWNEPFGASLSYAQLLAGADGLEFLRKGRARSGS